ncbi:Conserved_hypothetical protein [Hexamita inflata]|uniref:N-acetyltransferase domain-containing protein n=1 Tax=Hexamita inflata TaxID=28002 RepID=A0ABP1HE37_9EUKA
MLHVTPMKLFKVAYETVQKDLIPNTAITYKQIEGCKMMHRASHISHDERITGFASFIPSYLIKYVATNDTRKFIKKINGSIQYPLHVNQTNNQFGESIIITFLSASNEELKKVLYFPAVQAIFKQLPLVIPKISTVLDIQSILNNVQLIGDSFVIFPQDLDQLMLLEPTKAGPILTKSGNLLHPVIMDIDSELEIGSLIMREAFSLDPLSCVYEPNMSKRKNLVQKLAKTIAQDTLDRGTNYLMCQYTPKNASIQQAGVCAITSPPGSTDRFFGKDQSVAPIVFRHLGMHMFSVSKLLNRVHKQHSGQRDNHGYVAMLGSTVQNKGLGNAVLQIPEDIADQVKADFYLENSNTNNLKFYTGRGLVVQEEVEVKYQGRSCMCYAMRKDYQKK